MSLVNDMLNDLEKRRLEQPAQGENLEWLTGQAPAQKKSKRPLYIAVLLLALVVVSVLLLQQYQLNSSLPVAQQLLTQHGNMAAKTAVVNEIASPDADTDAAPSPSIEPARISAIDFEKNAQGLLIHINATQAVDYQITQGSQQLEISVDKVTAQLPQQLAPVQPPIKAVSFRPQNEGMVLLFDLQRAITIKSERINNGQLQLLIAPEPAVVSAKPVAPAKPVAAKSVATMPLPAAVNKTNAATPPMKTSTPLTLGQQDSLVVKEATAAIRSGDEAAAEDKLQRFLQRYPEAPAANTLLIELLIKQNRLAAAQTLLDTQPALISQSSALRRLQAHLLVLNKDPEKAVQLLLSKQPDIKSETPYYELLAMAAQRAQQYSLSVQVYKSLLRFDAGQGSWWVGLAISEELMGLKADARADFLQAMRAGRITPSLRDYARSRYDALAGAVNVYPSSSAEGANGE
ncbi:tetratricopeptide repeat protein [Dasania sp. GY-MA-18]|uniref:Tetratricopeptide repeat protein n=1 Tax=Dasania phycosphaerae TaxID=2950436 RepID=A0A9J6RMR5_9GAMM|nr:MULTISPECIES: tetratricopeptide repeat protein [Dasania]MCR8923049.1 tetratricopeptide repeat protein [Dasania sp. GY-MA-18]MCZ0865480.1 tetratricopeptide repeat protein [Dasania phycosphaerae]MCZ0869205.1 tetratricopeptide repeat protein [Dasania phycosphaerae]